MNQFIEASVSIRAPVVDVWRIITDTKIWPEWGPSVRNIRCSDRFITSGSRGYVQTAFGFWVPFEISDYRYSESWTLQIYHMKATGHRIERIDADKCRLIFDMPILMAPYWFICVIAIRKIRKLAENNFRHQGKNV